MFTNRFKLGNQYHKIEWLARDEEDALIELAQKGDTEARNRIVKAYMPLVFTIVSRFKVEDALIREELVQLCLLAFLECFGTYIKEKGRFSTYARACAESCVKAYFSDSPSVIKIPRRLVQYRKAVMKTADTLRKRGEKVTNDKLSHKTGFSVKKIKGFQEIANLLARSLEEPVGVKSLSGDAVTLGQNIVDDSPTPEEATIEADSLNYRRELLKKAVSCLKPHEWEILKGRFALNDDEEDVLLRVLGDTYGISRERVRQIAVKAFTKLQRRIKTLETA